MSSPKEKAQELFDKFYIVCQEYTEEIQCSIQAKKCAIISVDLIIEELESYSDLESIIVINNFSFSVIELISHWKEVKRGITKL